MSDTEEDESNLIPLIVKNPWILIVLLLLSLTGIGGHFLNFGRGGSAVDTFKEVPEVSTEDIKEIVLEAIEEDRQVQITRQRETKSEFINRLDRIHQDCVHDFIQIRELDFSEAEKVCHIRQQTELLVRLVQ